MENSNDLKIENKHLSFDVEKSKNQKIITKLNLQDSLIEFIMNVFRVKKRDNVLEHVVNFISEKFHANCAFIGKLEENNTARIIAVSKSENWMEGINISLTDSPFELLLNKKEFINVENANKAYPKNELLSRIGAIVFCGVPLWDTYENTSAFLVLLDNKKRDDIDLIAFGMRVLSTFVTGQMHRIYGESKLRENEIFFEDLQIKANIGIFKVNFLTQEYETSDILNQIIGIDKNFIKNNENIVKVIHPEDYKKVRDYIISDVYNEQLHFDKEFRIRKINDGITRWVYVQALIKYVNEQPVNIMGTLTDVTERKLREEKLKQNELLLSLAQRASHSGIWSYNYKTEEIKWSEEFFLLLGLDSKKNDPSVEIWSQRIHPDDVEYAVNNLKNAIETKQKYFNEYRIVQPEGKIIWIYTIGETTMDENKVALYTSGISVDITERKKMEEDLLRSLNEQKAINGYFVDRELRMVELKQEVNNLLTELGRTKKYGN